VVAEHSVRRVPPVTGEAGRRCRMPSRQRYYAVLEGAPPEDFEVFDLVLPNKDVRPPEFAQIFVMTGAVSRPLQEALWRGARIEQRRDQRLPEAQVGIDGLCVPPCLEEMMIRTNGVGLGAGFVECTGKGDRKLRFRQSPREELRSGVVVKGVH